MLSYEQFIKAKDKLNSVAKENFNASSYGETLACVVPPGCQPDSEMLFPFRNRNNDQNDLDILEEKKNEKNTQASTTSNTIDLSFKKTNVVNDTQSDSIVDPRKLSNSLSEEQIADLFVETCFFARLGFVQPPCCMLCTYRESMTGSLPNKKCNRWVVWRLDASKVLHPNKLSDNIVAVKCHTARLLQKGSEVDGYQWNEANKTLSSRR